jgi:hypothetical protein
MPIISADIRNYLKDRIDKMQKEVSELENKRREIADHLVEKVRELEALKTVYGSESKRLGESAGPLFNQAGKSYRFAGMKVGEALRILLAEQPEVTKRQAAEILQKEGLDFGSKRPVHSVHFALVSLDRERKNKAKKAANAAAITTTPSLPKLGRRD